MGLSITDRSPVFKQFATTREFLGDRATLTENTLAEKWDSRFKEFYDGQIVTKRLTDAVLSLKCHEQGPLRQRLKSVLGGDLSPNFEPSQAKDIFYELELAADFCASGFTTTLREPDIAIADCGLQDQYGVACKYPSSESQIHAHLSKGYSQLTRQSMRGFVAIGFDLLIFKEIGKFIDFRQGHRAPLDVMQGCMNEAMTNLVTDRAEKYPSEAPIDGALFTLRASGIYGAPAQLTTVTAVTIQCDSKNPMAVDIGHIHKTLRSLCNVP